MTPQLAQAYMLMVSDPHGDGPHLTGCYGIGGVGIDADGTLWIPGVRLVPAYVLAAAARRMWRKRERQQGQRKRE